MLRFLLDKFKETSGPLKDTRVAVGDVLEELLDVADHYIKRLRKQDTVAREEIPASESTSSSPPVAEENNVSLNTSTAAAPSKREASEKAMPTRTLKVPKELAAAVDATLNRKKQEFKVLAILWDANNRAMGSLSAKQLSDHGAKLGLEIRHENIRKVIRMRLENYVDIHQDRRQGHTLYHYKITPKGVNYFSNKYLIN